MPFIASGWICLTVSQPMALSAVDKKRVRCPAVNFELDFWGACRQLGPNFKEKNGELVLGKRSQFFAFHTRACCLRISNQLFSFFFYIFFFLDCGCFFVFLNSYFRVHSQRPSSQPELVSDWDAKKVKTQQ